MSGNDVAVNLGVEVSWSGAYFTWPAETRTIATPPEGGCRIAVKMEGQWPTVGGITTGSTPDAVAKN